MTTIIRKASAVQLVQDPNAILLRKATALAFNSDVGVTLRDVQGYAFEQVQPAATLRNIQGYAFEKVQALLPLSKTGDLALYDLINNNRKVPTAFSSSNTTLGTPTALSSPDANGHNTSIALTAKAGTGYSGSTTFYYLRRPLTDAIPAGTSISLGTIASATNVWALLPTINTKYGLSLVQQDVVNTAVPAGAGAIVLTIADGSYLFVPGSQSVVGIQSVLSSAVAVTALPGFTNAAGVGPGAPSATLLMHFDDATSLTSLLKDSSGKNLATSSGTVAAGTPAKFGANALSVAASAVVNVPDAAWLRFTGSDATLEAWVNPSNVTTQNGILFAKDTASPTVYADVQYYNGLWRVYFDSASPAISVSANMALNTWYHIALVSYQGVWYLYQNGVLLGQATGGTFGNNSNAFTIGNFAGKTANFNGLIDEVRISQVARYTAPFTPPSAAFVAD
jgi:hypothetical protein